MIDFIVRWNPRVTTPFPIYFYTSDLNTLIRLLLKLVLTERGQWEPYSNQNGELCNHITFENNEGKLYAVSGLIMFTEHTESCVQVENRVFLTDDYSHLEYVSVRKPRGAAGRVGTGWTWGSDDFRPESDDFPMESDDFANDFGRFGHFSISRARFRLAPVTNSVKRLHKQVSF